MLVEEFLKIYENKLGDLIDNYIGQMQLEFNTKSVNLVKYKSECDEKIIYISGKLVVEILKQSNINTDEHVLSDLYKLVSSIIILQMKRFDDETIPLLNQFQESHKEVK